MSLHLLIQTSSILHYTFTMNYTFKIRLDQMQQGLSSFTLSQVPAGGGLHRHHPRCKVPAGQSAARTSRGWRREDRWTDQYRAFGQWDRHINKRHGHQRVSILLYRLLIDDQRFHHVVIEVTHCLYNCVLLHALLFLNRKAELSETSAVLEAFKFIENAAAEFSDDDDEEDSEGKDRTNVESRTVRKQPALTQS